VHLLFIGEQSKLALTDDVVLDEKARTITFKGWRQVDVFRLPGSPHTPVFTGHTVLTVRWIMCSFKAQHMCVHGVINGVIGVMHGVIAVSSSPQAMKPETLQL
jgi:hypothetical protein